MTTKAQIAQSLEAWALDNLPLGILPAFHVIEDQTVPLGTVAIEIRIGTEVDRNDRLRGLTGGGVRELSAAARGLLRPGK